MKIVNYFYLLLITIFLCVQITQTKKKRSFYKEIDNFFNKYRFLQNNKGKVILPIYQDF